MIIDLPDTTTGTLNRKLVELRESGGAIALSRVLTLVIITEDGQSELSIQAANDASREHPCRVICLVRGTRRGSNRLDAQIRVGGDAGASEVIVLRLYGQLAEHGDSVVIPLLLPDAPTVAWWPGTAPDVPAQDPIGAMAQRRITDAAMSAKPARALEQRSRTHAPGDTDLAWSRITLWRGLLAAALDQPPYEPVRSATVTSGADSPSGDLLAAWLALYLQCPVRRVRTRVGSGLTGVHLERASGPVDLVRPDGKVAALTQPGQPERRIALAPRADRDCLTEELRRLDPDDVYGAVVTKGMALLAKQAAAKKATAPKAPAQKAPAQKATAKTRARKAPAAAKGTGDAVAST
jgi:glucose-6-phosphate dehydrogenase assembly protein OpcA